MRNILNPKWLFIVNTLPIAVLFILFYGQFNIIKSLLDEQNLYFWKFFGLTLGILGLLNLAYTIYLTFKKKNVPMLYGIIALVGYITLIYLYLWHINDIFPSHIPRWMVSERVMLYVFTFLMPTLAYSLLVLVTHFTPEIKTHKIWVNFLIAIAIPLAGFLLSLLGNIIGQFFDDVYRYVYFLRHIFTIFIIVATIVFLFFLIRGIFILVVKKGASWQKYQLVWKIPIAILFPILGLLINNGWDTTSMLLDNSGIFGDFSNPWFYILALLNGILICLPNLDHKLYRLFLFIGRSITFAYTCYFFLVFLPFLPLSIVAIIAIGVGFLMLTPLMLFMIHINEISKDFKYLKMVFPKRLIMGITVLGFLVIPVWITTTYLKDKSVLNQTLDYLYSPDYSKQYHIDKNSLQKTLNVVRHHKDGNFFLDNRQIPYLSSYFNWLVLDNLTLSDAKINHIEKIFFKKTSFELRPETIQNDSVEITNISTSSTYDKSQNAWKSWVDLEITNKNENGWFAEYATTLDLPEGCWISDYYLYVDSVKESGILAEKKAARWIFSQIRGVKRDPGILYYLTGNKVAFRVFPFANGEVRKTGIEFLHKEPVKLRIDNHTVELGNTEEAIYENVENENVAYISAQQKQSLKAVKRKPCVYFLVDVSKDTEESGYATKNSEEYLKVLTTRIETFMAGNPEFSENAQISFVNSYVNTFPLHSDWKQKYQSQTFEGGFYLDRAIKTVLFNAYKNNCYPVIVVVTDDIQNAFLDKDFSDFKFAFPESDLFFSFDSNGNLQEHSFIDNPQKQLPFVKRECQFCETVLEYKLSDSSIVYLPNNDKPSIVLKKDIFAINPQEIKEKNWQSALLMQAKWMSQILHPETADKEWQNMVKYSFTSKVMTPVTSYLVVENDAQKAMLKKKQEQALSANKSLDLGEDTQAMSEPSLWILAVLLGFALLCKQIRKRRRMAFIG